MSAASVEQIRAPYQGAGLDWLRETVAASLADNSGQQRPCAPWPYGRNGNGYGRVWVDGKHQYAHRVACVMSGREIPDGNEVAHAEIICHDRLCCEPSHLEAVTPSENQEHRIMDGTHDRGNRSGSVKVSDSDALWLLANPEGLTQRQQADALGVTRQTVSHITNPNMPNRSWLLDPIPDNPIAQALEFSWAWQA